MYFLLNKGVQFSNHFEWFNFIYRYKQLFKIVRNIKTGERAIILGIESSCDDTGCGIVDSTGNVLGEAIHHQHITHLKYGGIIPIVAETLHRKSITKVCEDALRSANLKLRDIDAIATTVKPGLPLSLTVGTDFGKYLSSIGNKPFIPIHHMEAHALTARMTEKLDFPYLVLLMSGGHCLIAVAENVDKFYLLGRNINNSPGNVFDLIARRMKLMNIPEFAHLVGGKAIEMAARRATDLNQFSFPINMRKEKSCHFSFSGILSESTRYITQQEHTYNIIGDQIIPDVYNLCAGIQLAIAEHICDKVQKAMKFTDVLGLIPQEKQTLVISGGVASNDFIAETLNILCVELNWRFVRTPRELCTDNGVMIAWNGVEKWITCSGVIKDKSEIDQVQVEAKVPFGLDWSQKVQAASVEYKRVNIKNKLLQNLNINEQLA